MGGGEVDIRYDVPLDDSLFRTEPPEGYAVEVKKRDRVTEKEMIEYFGIVAEFNDKTFPDRGIPGAVEPAGQNRTRRSEEAAEGPDSGLSESSWIPTCATVGVLAEQPISPILIFFA